MSKHGPRVCSLVALAGLAAGCGARTGLLVPDVERISDADPQDAALDAADAPDVMTDVLRPPRECYPLRVRTRVGSLIQLRPAADSLGATDFQWSMLQKPTDSMAMLFVQSADMAVLTPDRAGEYDVQATTTSPDADGGTLVCPITVIADPPDPRCPDYAIEEPFSVTIPGGDMQVALDVVWGTPGTGSNGGAGAVVADDPIARVSAAVLERPTTGDVSDPAGALVREGTAAEGTLMSALGATAVLVGRTAHTHEGFPLRRTTLEITTPNPVSPGDLRDGALRALAGVSAQDEAASAQAPAADFYLELATILRPDTRSVVTVVTISPVATYDDAMESTSIRSTDLVNGTALARTDNALDIVCYDALTTRPLEADFLWLVDTSGSMQVHQHRIGRAAVQFFSEMSNAGLDFRVGVIEAGNTAPHLEGTPATGPFHWISGSDPNGPRQMAWEVTDDAFESGDNLRPFPTVDTGGVCPENCHEEPMAEAILSLEEFDRRARAGTTNPDFVLRPNASHVTFFVTDEPAIENDIGRFFGLDPMRWGNTDADLQTSISNDFAAHQSTPFGLVPPTPPTGCPDTLSLDACVITTAGGAFVPIDIANETQADRAFSSALTRVVDAVAGTASEFVLPHVPVSASLAVRVDRRVAPRSRADGFDYADGSNSLVFRGPSFHPRVGAEVRAAFFYWVHDP